MQHNWETSQKSWQILIPLHFSQFRSSLTALGSQTALFGQIAQIASPEIFQRKSLIEWTISLPSTSCNTCSHKINKKKKWARNEYCLLRSMSYGLDYARPSKISVPPATQLRKNVSRRTITSPKRTSSVRSINDLRSGISNTRPTSNFPPDT